MLVEAGEGVHFVRATTEQVAPVQHAWKVKLGDL